MLVAGGCLTKKKHSGAYLYNPGIMGIMLVAGGCLTRKKRQWCLAV